MSEQQELFPLEELQQEVNIPEAKPITDAEWCFQFFNNEPIVFAWSNEGEKPSPLTLQLEPVEGEGLNFQQNGMVFKIFPRAIGEETKKQRAEQNVREVKEA
jgi:hypothetical protein